MALMTAAQYVESLKKLKLKVYMFGELIENPAEHVNFELKLF
jgi:4-hydroxybutyryl-CoA dehydratase/vinylacetyl-CoA-Delta-isomerase